MAEKDKVLVTGAGGFVGRALVEAFGNINHIECIGGLRRGEPIQTDYCRFVVLGDLIEQTDRSQVLEGVNVVVHAAARVHVMNDSSTDPLLEYRKSNVEATLDLAEQAANAGVRRFIFISTIKVNGERTESEHPFSADDIPVPVDPYAISKLEAEEGLQRLSKLTGMEVVIIRPPLVYGPGVKGNFSSMVKLVRSGIPLPFGCIDNKRSLVALDNLTSLIVRCIDHPGAANQIFLAGDARDLSTTELLRVLAKVMNKPSRLIPVSGSILQWGAKLLGREAVAQRLLDSLQVDLSKNNLLLGWVPPVSVEDGLRRCFSQEV